MEDWQQYVKTLAAALDGVTVTSADGTLSCADGVRRWVEITREAQTRGRSIYLIGNGASAAMASHFAADACKNAGLRALAFNDASLLTAISNDVSFDDVFALPILRLSHPGDLLISISSSGRSPNIVRALEAGRSVSMAIVTLSGKSADNPSRALGDLNFYVPNQHYGFVESAHMMILHYWLDRYLSISGRGV